jgi:AP-5 complex subunit sigma-1
VAGRVQAEFNFRLSTHIKGPGEKEGDPIKLSQDELQGLFRLPAGQPFSSLKVVAWLVAHNCAFVFILDDDENRLLAFHSLLTISTLVKDYIIKDQTASEILLKPDKMALILVKFLPNGNMLFLNSKVVKQYEKEIEPYLKEKV